ncbi:MAG TPA: hypothetical protein DCP92_19495, partial [Nitrospiraceae bacterium]|nr:hypothetical protein [Nitrospiraceae bacterium]
MADQWEESKETIKEKLKLLGENYLKQLLERLNEIEACYKALLRESGISCADYDMLIEIVRLLSATQS